MSDDGQALIEFALVLPFLLLFTVAIVLAADVGVARIALEHGAAEGARVGALTNDDERIAAAVSSAVTPLRADAVAITVEPTEHQEPRSHDPRGSLLRVSVRYVIPVPLAFAGLPAIAVAGSATRMIEWTP